MVFPSCEELERVEFLASPFPARLLCEPTVTQYSGKEARPFLIEEDHMPEDITRARTRVPTGMSVFEAKRQDDQAMLQRDLAGLRGHFVCNSWLAARRSKPCSRLR